MKQSEFDRISCRHAIDWQFLLIINQIAIQTPISISSLLIGI